MTLRIHQLAVKVARDHAISLYDALMVAAASDAGRRVLLTEDLQHGRKICGVTISNPSVRFSHAPATPLPP